MKFIWQTVCVAILLLIGYNCFLKVSPPREDGYQPHGLWEESVIKAEKFQLSDQDYNLIVVGSSILEGVKLNVPHKKCLTLNFVGGSSLTGLEIIKLSKNLPQIIVIETNWLERGPDYRLIEKLNPFNFFIRSTFPSSIHENQPINVFAKAFNFKQTLLRIKKLDENFLNTLNQNVEIDNKPIDMEGAKKSILQVNECIRFFESKGVKVYLMEVPVNAKLRYTKKIVAIRNLIHEIIPDIHHLPNYPTPDSLQTFDGYHFRQESRITYGKFLSNFFISEK